MPSVSSTVSVSRSSKWIFGPSMNVPAKCYFVDFKMSVKATAGTSSLAENLGKRGGVSVRAPDPTGLQIRIACRRIKKAWSPLDYRLRRYYQER
jgi:hypothetical protein